MNASGVSVDTVQKSYFVMRYCDFFVWFCLLCSSGSYLFVTETSLCRVNRNMLIDTVAVLMSSVCVRMGAVAWFVGRARAVSRQREHRVNAMRTLCEHCV